MDNQFFVSVIIPCRNEKRFIKNCIDSILNQDYPKDKIEVLVIDGMSDDGTREIVNDYCKKDLIIKLLDNPKKIVPTALNKGILNARGDIIIRMDAHNFYESNYISKCVKYLEKYNLDNVGGVWVTLPGKDTVIAKSIALALSHPFGVGNANFRIGLTKPKYVDTVPFGCYKKKVFDRIGLFNENLVRNQDIEFNLRLKKKGGKILLAPDIVSYYYARSTFKELAKNNFWNGFWVIYSIKFANLPFSIRHTIPAIFTSSLLLSLFTSLWLNLFTYLYLFILSIYIFLNLFFSLRLSLQKGLKYIIPLSLAFSTLHFSYGSGSIWGMVKLIASRFNIKGAGNV